MDKVELEHRLADVPMYVSWVHQGRLWWDDEWVRTNGPTRTHIPGLDDHVSFANYDLKLNLLPALEWNADGRLFIMCIDPLTDVELLALSPKPLHMGTYSELAQRSVAVGQMDVVRRILDLLAFHGFFPANRTPGLDYLDSVFPRRELRKSV